MRGLSAVAARVFGVAWRRTAPVVLGVPLLTLALMTRGDNPWIVLAAIGLQGLLLGWALARLPVDPAAAPGGAGQPGDRAAVLARLATPDTGAQGPRTAALAIRLDDEQRIEGLYGRGFVQALAEVLGDRLAGALREADLFCRLDGGGYGVALVPQRRLDVGRVLSVAQRIQHQVSEPFTHDRNTVWPSVSIGFCLSPRAAALNGIDMLTAAERAADKAVRAGPNGLNSFSVVDFPAALSGDQVAALRRALAEGQIRAHFQPQIRTDTGRISGLEALARWHHPERGLIPPAEFLPQIETAGLAPLLTETILRDALQTLADLDRRGLSVPTVSVNLSAEDLGNPRLADEIAWALDTVDLGPERLCIEILETVIARDDDDVAVHTVARLAGLGCGVDLDDFGTGHASIASIRRFAVGRIKIDRSFVTRMHVDENQRRMVAAVLSMAHQLGLGTVAEGVESAGEQVLLAQMGCDHLQGYGIARPMPGSDLPGWIAAHESALATGEPWSGSDDGPRTGADGRRLGADHDATGGSGPDRNSGQDPGESRDRHLAARPEPFPDTRRDDAGPAAAGTTARSSR